MPPVKHAVGLKKQVDICFGIAPRHMKYGWPREYLLMLGVSASGSLLIFSSTSYLCSTWGMTWSSSLLQWCGACGTTATRQGLSPLDKLAMKLSTKLTPSSMTSNQLTLLNLSSRKKRILIGFHLHIHGTKLTSTPQSIRTYVIHLLGTYVTILCN